MRGLAAAVLAAGAATAAAAQEARDLLCEAKDGERFWIMLWAPSTSGEPLHCVEAPELAATESCAPDGGWGLSRAGGPVRFETEAAGIAHDGGWFFARVGPTELVASAAVGSRIPYALEIGGETFWRLRLTLATGEGSVFTRDGETRITCRPA